MASLFGATGSSFQFGTKAIDEFLSQYLDDVHDTERGVVEIRVHFVLLRLKYVSIHNPSDTAFPRGMCVEIKGIARQFALRYVKYIERSEQDRCSRPGTIIGIRKAGDWIKFQTLAFFVASASASSSWVWESASMPR